MTGALSVQARSARTLAAYPAGPVTLTISDGIFKRAVVLDFMDAACVERAVRLRSEAILSTPAARCGWAQRARWRARCPHGPWWRR